MKRWIQQAQTEAKSLTKLTRRIGRYVPNDEAAPRWFLFREQAIRVARLRRLVRALDWVGTPESKMRSVVSTAVRRAEQSSRRFIDNEYLRLELHEHSHQLGRVHVPRGRDGGDYLGQVVRAAWDLTDLEYLDDELRRLHVRERLRYADAGDYPWHRWFDTLTTAERDDFARGAANYRRAWLLLQTKAEPLHFACLRTDSVSGEMMHMIDAYISAALGDLTDSNVASVVYAVVRHLRELLEDVGTDGLDEVLHGAGPGTGRLGPESATEINIIPSGGKDARCCPVVLATIRGSRGRRGAKTVLQELRQHLYRCKDQTRVAIVLTDNWDLGQFEAAHADDWRAAHRSGVRYLVFLTGHGTRGLNPIWMDLR